MVGSNGPGSSATTRAAASGFLAGGRVRALAALAFVSWLSYIVVASLGQSLHEASSGDDSLLLQLGFFGLAFACYLAAIRIGITVPSSKRLLALIVMSAVIFRLTLLLSDPIEEIDIYRYMWDGAALDCGTSPFRYSPHQVLEASVGDEMPEDLQKLVSLRDQSPALHAILRRVHFGDLPTIYPPVAQVVFAAADRMTPAEASVTMRMRIMRAVFIGFDLFTTIVLMALLRLTGQPIGWAIAHAWCPLVVKEIANSGHLDALATFLSIAAMYLALRSDPRRTGWSKRVSVVCSLCAVMVFSLAVGAKLYPIILLPVLFAIFCQQYGRAGAAGLALVALLLLCFVVWPMVPTGELEQIHTDSIPVVVSDEPPLPPEEISLAPKEPSQSLRAFLSRWEMNDFLFLIVIENLRPTDQLPTNEVAWFSVLPERVRIWLTAPLQTKFDIDAQTASFLITRTITSGIFVTLAVLLARRAYRADCPQEYLNVAFLTVAWFWLFLPTQNPWYWTWAVPFLPFSRNRAWLAVSGLAFMYYMRFWLVANFPNESVLGTGYNGALFFDYVVTWLEFGPWFCWLGFEAYHRRRVVRSSGVRQRCDVGAEV